ncbi:hypothetical protein N7463_000655 [Penicillium fimorum]|uniref:Uncharacterized protein n=1 Tax=Penicillium fimorum TaxID=1882269 RepID=A0A9W9Y4Q9_9EURO|nr:hypothetical protein N7463_000655 [Penicillium fimorum]
MLNHKGDDGLQFSDEENDIEVMESVKPTDTVRERFQDFLTDMEPLYNDRKTAGVKTSEIISVLQDRVKRVTQKTEVTEIQGRLLHFLAESPKKEKWLSFLVGDIISVRSNHVGCLNIKTKTKSNGQFLAVDKVFVEYAKKLESQDRDGKAHYLSSLAQQLLQRGFSESGLNNPIMLPSVCH